MEATNSVDNRQDYLTIEAACLRAGVSRRTIYNWLNKGKLEFVRTAGDHIRINPESLWRVGNADDPV